MKTYTLKFQLLLSGLLLINNPIFSQRKFELSGGFGLPEFFNLKLRYGHNIQVGASAGIFYMPFGNPWDWSCNTEVVYHFSGTSKYIDQATWYFSSVLSVFDGEGMGPLGDYDYCDIGISPRVGRTFNFSNRIGINLDLGILFPFSKGPGYNNENFKILSSGSLSLFIRF